MIVLTTGRPRAETSVRNKFLTLAFVASTVVLVAACGDAANEELVGLFSATVTGRDSGSVSGEAIFGSALGNGSPGWAVQLQDGDFLGDYDFIHIGRADTTQPEVGTYPIVSDSAAGPGDFVARYQSVAQGTMGTDDGTFFNATSGSLAITRSEDGQVEGTFTFTAQGSDSSSTIDVSGPFVASHSSSAGNATLEGNWYITWSNVVEGASSYAALSLYKPLEHTCDTTATGACMWVHRRNEAADWALSGGYGDSFENVYYPNVPQVHPGGMVEIQQPYYVLGYWGGKSKAIQAGPNDLLGSWTYGDDNAGGERWRRAIPNITRVKFLSDVESELAFGGGSGLVRMQFDGFWWGPENDMRGNRPEFWVEVYGDNLWGHHVVDVLGGPDIELTGFSFIRDAGETGAAFNVIGLRAGVTIWEQFTVGPKAIVVDGIEIPFDFIVSGHPSNTVTDSIIDRASEIVEAVAAGEIQDSTEAARRVIQILDTYDGDDPEIDEMKNLLELLVDRQGELDSAEIETLIDKIRDAAGSATEEEGWQELRDEIFDRASHFAALMANGEYDSEDATRLLNIAKYGAQALDDMNDISGALTGENSSGVTNFLTTAYGVAATLEGVRTADGEMLVDGMRDVISQVPGMDKNPLTSVLDIPAEVTASMIGVTRDGFEEVTGAMEAIAAAIGGDESAMDRAFEHSRNVERVLSGENYGQAMSDAITNRIIDKIPFARTVVAWFTNDDE